MSGSMEWSCLISPVFVWSLRPIISTDYPFIPMSYPDEQIHIPSVIPWGYELLGIIEWIIPFAIDQQLWIIPTITIFQNCYPVCYCWVCTDPSSKTQSSMAVVTGTTAPRSFFSTSQGCMEFGIKGGLTRESTKMWKSSNGIQLGWKNGGTYFKHAQFFPFLFDKILADDSLNFAPKHCWTSRVIFHQKTYPSVV